MPVGHPPFKELAQRYTRLFEAAQDGILILDFPTGRIDDVNPYLCNLIGTKKEQLLGKSFWGSAILIPTEKGVFIQKELLENGYVRIDDIPFKAKNGTTIPTELICNSYEIDGGKVVQCNIREITRRKETERLLDNERIKMGQLMADTIDSLSNVIEARDPYTSGHQARVADLAVAIGHELRLTSAMIDCIRFVAQIHDIGKISIPAEILTKPSALTPLETAMLKQHVQAGFDIIKPIDFPWPVKTVLLQHHERLDGSGYPHGLKNSSICLEARIIAVADTVEATTSHRPYRAAKSLDVALSEIKAGSGVLYDKNVVEACLRLFLEKGYQFPPPPKKII